ncbi:hypothetical protein BH09ACT6_BH09ACT6_13280 [soil metagenome]
MKKTSPTSLIILGLIGVVVTALLEFALAAAGRPVVIPPVTLAIALAAIGIILIVLAVPIRRLAQGKAAEPVDPFYATRIVMLAKASALGGALITGVGIGVLVYLLTRPVAPALGSVGLAVATIVGAAILLTCGLVAEFMCRIPPGDDDDDDGPSKVPVRLEP